MRTENESYAVAVDPRTGAVHSVVDKAAQIEVIAEPRLAESFRLLLPLPDLEANYLLGTEQAPPAIERTAHGLAIRWAGPLTNARGRFDLAVTTRIGLAGDSIQFRTTVENHSDRDLAEVWHAALGGTLGLGDRKATKTLIPSWGTSACENLFQDFPESMGVGGGGGFRFPEFYVEYPSRLSMPWLDIYNPGLGRGVYFACHDTVPRVSVLRFEMHPGIARRRAFGNWPTDDEIAPLRDTYPPGVVLHWVNLPYTPPGGTFESPPVVLRSHAGDWHAAAKIYREWFLAHFPVRKSSESWLRREQAVQDTLFLLPEGNRTATFQEIPRLAKEAADYGVKTVMISGWSVGGHDNQYPNYTPDPRLGTWDDLAKGIAACHALGVRVLFFSNIQWADESTEQYRKELHSFRVASSKGETGSAGWGMGTLGARMGHTRPPLVQVDPAFPAFREIIVRQMAKLAEIGADGVHYDKVGGGSLDFNPRLPAPRDQAYPAGLIACIEETLAACRRIRPDFCLSVESHWDRLLSTCDAWWLWYDSDHAPVMKYAFPEFLPTFAVAQPWDYASVNRAVLCGYQILVGPVRYSASMADSQSQPISAYIREVIRIREELKDTLFLGDFLDDQEVSVAPAPHLTWKVHRNPATRKRACVLVNAGPGPVTTHVGFHGNPAAPARVYHPFEKPASQRWPAELSIPAERLAIVLEE